MQTRQIDIPLKGAEYANVGVDVGAGELKLHGGATQLIDGEVSSNRPGFTPAIRDSMNGEHAVVNIRDHSEHGWGGGGHTTWDLALSDRAILDLSVHFGAGQAQLRLGDVDLRALEVNMGAGQVDVDLRGNPKRDYEVKITGGVGQATVRLPQNVGIRAEASGGLGNITVSGLRKKGDHYENDLYNKAKVNVEVTVRGGVGQIELIG